MTGSCDALPRLATAADAAAIAHVQAVAWQAGYRDIIPADHLAHAGDNGADRWSRILARRASSTYVMPDGTGTIAGITSVGPARGEDDPALGELWMLNVAPQAWGTGLAVTLHDYALDRLREAGYGSAILWVLTGNGRARHFYERAGWHADGGAKVDDFRGFPIDEMRYRTDLCEPV